ncbi:hypothetical protein PT974_03409 [Cladobotryum mycophilum]|uniref:Nucleic acid-binding, OB-fold protein n=1 Tax=Cladobotryum mycophilum TaxID=491253 RepID=A0ABR0SS78_9HYPO
MPSPKIILFTGAPVFSSVDTQSCTLHRFAHPFDKFLALNHYHDDEKSESPLLVQPAAAAAASHAVWRSLPLTRQPLHTGFSQNHNFQMHSFQGNLDFFTTADVTARIATSQSSEGDSYDAEYDGDDAENVLTQFCEEALAAHNATPLSQGDSFEQSQTEETSFMTNSTTELNTTLTTIPPPPPPIPGHLSDLEDIPSASRITALSPQTVTLNLIVAIISIAQPRTVTTRWGSKFSLVEVLVGDDTRSGFAVTFWLSADDDHETCQVAKLRRQDVALMENVALHVFRGKVYGQSLRRGMTKVSLLWRRDGGGYYSARDLTKRTAAAARHPQQEKARLVKDWVIHFVGRDPGSMRKREDRKSWDKPPDDTQD